jgi:hypothetical protein
MILTRLCCLERDRINFPSVLLQSTRRRPYATLTTLATQRRSDPAMFDRLLVDRPKCKWCTWRSTMLLSEEGDGQSNRRLASFSFRFLNGLVKNAPNVPRSVPKRVCPK